MFGDACRIYAGSPSSQTIGTRRLTRRSGSFSGLELFALPLQHTSVSVDDEPPARRVARVAADRARVGHVGASREPVVRLARNGPQRARCGAVVGEERRFMRMANE